MSTTVTRKVPPQVARVLYRSCLRASKNGRYPEVFSNLGAEVYNIQVDVKKDHPTLAMPSSSAHVRQRLKTWFQSPQLDRIESSSPLCALPRILEQADALKLQTNLEASKPSLYILESTTIGALTGEYLQFSLTDQDQIDLILLVASGTEPKRFLLRHGELRDTAIELKVLSHQMTLDHGLVVACLAGSRVKMDLDWVVDRGRSTVATKYSLLRDNPSQANSSKNRHARQYILDMLHCVLPNQDTDLSETLKYFGLPPLDPEPFSFWALRYVLPMDDVASRWKWAHDCFSTAQRLDFIMEEIESILDEMDNPRPEPVSSRYF